MRAHSWLVFVSVALAGITAGPAQADVSWSDPGWYVEATESGLDTSLISGPYDDEDSCDDARPEDTDDYTYHCDFEGTDPAEADPPRDRRD